MVLYLRQEGRGIGLTNKIRAYALQDRGHDTVEANHLLGFGDDERDYRVAADMLRALGVRSVQLMTNNPRKVEGLREQGIRVTGRLPLVTQANRHNAAYLLTKQKRSGHWLGIGESDAELAPKRCRRMRASWRCRASIRRRSRPAERLTPGRARAIPRRAGGVRARCRATKRPTRPARRGSRRFSSPAPRDSASSPNSERCVFASRSRSFSTRSGLTVSTV